MVVITPAGLGVAVVFMWALAVQLTTQGIAGLAGGLGIHHEGAGGLAGRLAAAALLAFIGESLRQGREWARLTVIVLTSLVAVSGFVQVIALLTGHGLHERAVFSVLIEVVAAPWIAFRLCAARTRSWFALASGGAAAAPPDAVRAVRTGARWLVRLAAQAVPWGTAVAVSQSLGA